MSQIESNIIAAVSHKPKRMPDIAKTSGVSLIKTCNTVARSGRKSVSCDRLAIEGRRVKIFRHDCSVQELRRGMKQLGALYALGARFDEVLIQVR